MAYQVIARKWRPQNFEDVVYQEHISKTIQNSIKQERISHAYLFSGPRGVGKTTLARILARALDCVNGPTAHPCGVCENCLEIKNGTSFDVVEIDGASNNGVDDIRQLRENINFAPAKSKYKVYIIDEVHMVTTQAFNALLKTLEEPPPHAVFIFATTEIHKIPDTILSRCQKFFFKKIPVNEIAKHLTYIAEKEGYNISKQAIYPIARAAEGSMRDGQSLLEQVISFAVTDNNETPVSEKDALTILGIVPIDSYIQLLNFVTEENPLATMEEINSVITLGIDIPRYIIGFMDLIKSLRLILNNVLSESILGLFKEEIESLKTIAANFSDQELSLIFKILNDLHKDLKFAVNERINLEMAILDMIDVKRAPSIASILAKLENGSAGTASNQPAKKKTIIEPKIKIKEPQLLQEKKYLFNVINSAKIILKDDTIFLDFGNKDEMFYSRILDDKNLTVLKNEFAKQIGHILDIKIATEDILKNNVAVKTDIDIKAENNKNSKKIIAEKNDETSIGFHEKEIKNEEIVEEIPLPDSEMIKNPEPLENEEKFPATEKVQEIFFGKIVKKGE